ncbi:MAG: hypothetical protein R2809_07585 [Flavobacteriales bacterium]
MYAPLTIDGESLYEKYTCLTHIKNGYLKKIILYAKDRKKMSNLNINDSLITMSALKELIEVSIAPNKESSIYINNDEGRYFEVSTDVPE